VTHVARELEPRGNIFPAASAREIQTLPHIKSKQKSYKYLLKRAHTHLIDAILPNHKISP